MKPRRFDLQNASAIPFAVAMIMGVTLCLFISVSESILLFTVLLLTLLALASLFTPGLRSYAVIVLLLFFVMLAWYRAESQLGREDRWLLSAQAAADDSVRLTGRVVISSFDFSNRGKVIVDQAFLEGKGFSIQLDDLRIRLFADSSLLAALRYGDIVHAIGRMRSSSERTARFTGALTGVLSKREACGVIVDPESLFIHQIGGYHLRRTIDGFRHWILRTFDESLSPDASALCRALVLGDRQDFGYRFQEQLRLTGLSHIFALSGLNTGLMISLLWVTLGVFFLPRNLRYLILLFAAVFYMELGREVPSLVRASLMCSTFLVGRLLQRRTLVINYLAIALGIELLWHPMDIVDPGFGLSYLSVLGMIAGYSAMKQTVAQLIDSQKSGMLKSSVEVFIGTITAQVGTLPLVGFLFHRLPLVGGIGNLLVVPGFALLLVLASLLLLFSAIAPWMVEFITPSIEGLGYCLGWIVDFFAGLPLAGIQIPEMSFLLMLTLYLLIFLIPVFWMLQRRRYAVQTALLLACIITWTGSIDEAENSRLTFIDVGNGDACLIESEGSRYLVDAGPRYGEWSAAKIVLPYLADRGIVQLDGLILTHPDTDHIGGAAELIQRIAVDRIWTNGDTSSSRTFIEFEISARSKGKKPQILSAGDIVTLSPSAHLSVLSPDSLSLLRLSESNQRSLAMILSMNSNSAFLAADIDSTVELELLSWGEMLDVDVLHAGHHGSKKSTSVPFLRATSPELCILTAGRRNSYGHPAPEVIERLNSLGIPYLITGQESTLVFESSGEGWKRIKPKAQMLSELWKLPYG
ncbi:DNA internalization-related competence protein ComEC/Rec2 [bacterium]|nr:MAG: DNA internalization-related competence protein ComEC/Rec2 [bacterium]